MPQPEYGVDRQQGRHEEEPGADKQKDDPDTNVEAGLAVVVAPDGDADEPEALVHQDKGAEPDAD